MSLAIAEILIRDSFYDDKLPTENVSLTNDINYIPKKCVQHKGGSRSVLCIREMTQFRYSTATGPLIVLLRRRIVTLTENRKIFLTTTFCTSPRTTKQERFHHTR